MNLAEKSANMMVDKKAVLLVYEKVEMMIEQRVVGKAAKLVMMKVEM
jgi:hypothetical protein